MTTSTTETTTTTTTTTEEAIQELIREHERKVAIAEMQKMEQDRQQLFV